MEVIDNDFNAMYNPILYKPSDLWQGLDTVKSTWEMGRLVSISLDQTQHNILGNLVYYYWSTNMCYSMVYTYQIYKKV